MEFLPFSDRLASPSYLFSRSKADNESPATTKLTNRQHQFVAALFQRKIHGLAFSPRRDPNRCWSARKPPSFLFAVRGAWKSRLQTTPSDAEPYVILVEVQQKL